MKSSNNQEDCEKMPFWVFNNYLVYFDEFLEKESGEGGNQEDASKTMSDTMASAKSMMKTPKPPKMKMPK